MYSLLNVNFLRPLSVNVVVSYSGSMMLSRMQNLPTKPLILILLVEVPPCLSTQGQIPSIVKRTFCTAAKENEAVGLISERGLVFHKVLMRIVFLCMFYWVLEGERNRKWNVTSHPIAQSLMLCAPIVPHSLAGEGSF